MDPNQIKQNISEEIFRNISARFQKNNENISRYEIFLESAYCMAVNMEILRRKLPPNLIPNNIEDLLLEGIISKLAKLFPKDFNDSYKPTILNMYSDVFQNPFKINEINKHYNELYGLDGGNVL